MFQLVFKGECVPGTDPAAVRNNAKALFKASVEQLDRMFSGQPVVIRNKLEQVQAEKYLAVLKKHGMVAYVQPMAGAVPSRPQPRQEPAPSAPERPASPAPAATGAAQDAPARNGQSVTRLRFGRFTGAGGSVLRLSLIHISEPTRPY